MRALLLAGVVAFGGVSIAKAEIVTNGGFETGDFFGWTVFGDTSYVGVAMANSAPQATVGNYRAYFGPVGANAGIYQLLNTVAGVSYNVSFDLANDGGTPNFASVDFGGTNLLSLSNAPAFGLTPYNFTAVATSAVTQLTFSFRQDPQYFNLDVVSVTNATAVPEPASLALLGMGVAGIAAVRRRRVIDRENA